MASTAFLRRYGPSVAAMTGLTITSGGAARLFSGPNPTENEGRRHTPTAVDTDGVHVERRRVPVRRTEERDFSRPRILFLGSGSSTGCPMPHCALAFPEGGAEEGRDEDEDEDGVDYGNSCSCRSSNVGKGSRQMVWPATTDPVLLELQKRLGSGCEVSKLGSWGDPRTNKNYRNNPCLLLSHRNDDDNDNEHDNDNNGDSQLPPIRNVIIDVGKTFRETSLRWMPPNRIASLDAIVLTHEHMDAMGGLDDVRGFQISKYLPDGTRVRPSTPVYLSSTCLRAARRSFPWLVPEDPGRGNGGVNAVEVEGGGKKKVVRSVAALTYDVVRPFVPFVAAGLRMVPLPVMHGEDLVCYGYAFTLRGAGGGDEEEGEGNKGEQKRRKELNVVYLSDISRMLPETQDYILNTLPPTDLLVIDALLEHRSNPVHYSLRQAIELVRVIKPKRTCLVGMACDNFRPHEEMNEELRNVRGVGDLQLAHDGLVVEV